MIYRIYICQNTVQAEQRLEALLDATGGQHGNYAPLRVQDVDTAINLDERLSTNPLGVSTVLKQMIQSGVDVYLFEVAYPKNTLPS